MTDRRAARRRGGRPVGRHRRGLAPLDATASEPSVPAAPTEEPAESVAPSPRAGRRRSSIATVLAVLCLPAAVAAIVFWVQTPAVPAAPSLVSSNSGQAVTAAKAAVHTILSYDYRSIATDIAKAKATTTGEFASQYAGTASQLLSEAKQVKAIVAATVGATGVVSTAPRNVVVLLFVDQASVRQVRGQKTPTTRIDQSRVRVTMTRVGSAWKVSALAAL